MHHLEPVLTEKWNILWALNQSYARLENARTDLIRMSQIEGMHLESSFSPLER